MSKPKKAEVKVPDGDAIKGKNVFNSQCAVCHSVTSGDDKNAAAPSLPKIVGRKIGSTAFPYSNAFKKQKIVWTPENLFQYIKGPGKFIPGNKMSFGGIQDTGDLGDLIAYLKTV